MLSISQRFVSQAGPIRASVLSSPGVRSTPSNPFRHSQFDQSVAHNLGSETKRATGIPMFMAIGQCGSVLGSHLYPATEGPHYM